MHAPDAGAERQAAREQQDRALAAVLPPIAVAGTQLSIRLPRVRALWPLFDEPLYVIGGGSYLSELMDAAGATNVELSRTPARSPSSGRSIAP